MVARITWLGHSAFHVRVAGRTLLIDPFIEGNPVSPLRGTHELGSVDLVLVTHEHGDHGLNEAIAICKERKAHLVSFFDLIQRAIGEGLPAELGVGGNIGGTVVVRDVKVTFTQAFHTCPIVGLVVDAGGFVLYHAADTGLFGDMAHIGRRGLDVALLPIGDYFTMGIADAVEAVDLLEPKVVIPMHYNTFPLIEADPEEFVREVGRLARVVVLRPGQGVELEGGEELPPLKPDLPEEPEPAAPPEPAAVPEPTPAPEQVAPPAPTAPPEHITVPEPTAPRERITLPEPTPAPEQVTPPAPTAPPERITLPEPTAAAEQVTPPTPAAPPERITVPEPAPSTRPLPTPEPAPSTRPLPTPEPAPSTRPLPTPEPAPSTRPLSGPETAAPPEPIVEAPPPPEPVPEPEEEEDLPLEPGQIVDLEGWADLPDDLLPPTE
jgi:L-ascorbate metabolism protein UlaG (beta-lactamase superfamily)